MTDTLKARRNASGAPSSSSLNSIFSLETAGGTDAAAAPLSFNMVPKSLWLLLPALSASSCADATDWSVGCVGLRPGDDAIFAKGEAEAALLLAVAVGAVALEKGEEKPEKPPNEDGFEGAVAGL